MSVTPEQRDRRYADVLAREADVIVECNRMASDRGLRVLERELAHRLARALSDLAEMRSRIEGMEKGAMQEGGNREGGNPARPRAGCDPGQAGAAEDAGAAMTVDAQRMVLAAAAVEALRETPSYWIGGGFDGGVRLYAHTHRNALEAWRDSVRLLGISNLKWFSGVFGPKTEAEARERAAEHDITVIDVCRIEAFWASQAVAR